MTHISQTLAVALFTASLPLAAAAVEAPVHATPQDALEALMAALEDGSAEGVVAVLGPEAEELVREDSSEERAEDWATVIGAYEEGYRFVPEADGRVGIVMGEDDWPFPIDLVRHDSGWQFDVTTGREEIADRLIGLNELDVIDAMEAYVDIQREFRLVDHDGDGVLEFAANIISSEGARDGLYWPGGDSPIGNAAARASLDGFSAEGEDTTAEPFFGYYFRMLNAQGDAAPGGAMDYMVGGNQLSGHALLAVPAIYGETGVHSFLVAENGVLFQADLGEDTLETALGITTYNPDDAWTTVE